MLILNYKISPKYWNIQWTDTLSLVLLAFCILLNINVQYILRLPQGRFGTSSRNLWDKHRQRYTLYNVIKR